MLQTIPPFAVYIVVGLVIGLESLGIPLPGEIALVSAALLASRHTLEINPVGVGAAASGAIFGCAALAGEVGLVSPVAWFAILMGAMLVCTSRRILPAGPRSCVGSSHARRAWSSR